MKHSARYNAEKVDKRTVGLFVIRLLHDCLRARVDRMTIEKRIGTYLEGFDKQNRKYVLVQLREVMRVLSDGLLDLASGIREKQG